MTIVQIYHFDKIFSKWMKVAKLISYVSTLNIGWHSMAGTFEMRIVGYT